MLTRTLNSLVSLLQPDPFRVVASQPAATLADLQRACDWSNLVREYGLPEGSSPLTLGSLRFSRVFPEMFLRKTEEAVVVLTVDEAAQAVRDAARTAQS